MAFLFMEINYLFHLQASACNDEFPPLDNYKIL